MSINLRVVCKNCKDDETDIDSGERYYPIISTGASSEYAEYWEPVINQLNLEWVWLVQAAGIPLLQHLEQLPEIQGEFQRLYEAISLNTSISSEMKEHLLNRIELITEIIGQVRTAPENFSYVYLG